LKIRDRVESTLTTQLKRLVQKPCPPHFAAALESAVFPGGGRVRPMLVLAVARALGVDEQHPHLALAEAGASALELLHCASLVHDDLPCFDDAAYRRGLPTVHAAYGECTAVLVGDALIVASFQCLVPFTMQPGREALAGRMLAIVGDAAGSPRGIAAGQAWEAEPSVDLVAYHDAKTASMFEAAVMLGALAAGASPAQWRPVGRLLGEAYQLADDLADLAGDAQFLGKPVRQDARNDRPNAARHLGVHGATLRLRRTLEAACEAVPDCPGRDGLIELVNGIGMRLLTVTAPAADTVPDAAVA
jgi:geranylgeranyl diphosphate synthase type II